ncbi:MAG: DUF4339 domain-containing protein [Planctomycetaceae bacterium]|nr:DUF4339 domain-containing protein [Planctomycetaceae bacterium]
MTPVEWYYARDNKQMGPVPAAELKRLATAGELRPDDLVWREGMGEWAAARNVRGLFEGEQKPAAAVGGSGLKLGTAEPQQPQPAKPSTVGAGEGVAPSNHLFDLLLAAARPHFGPQFVDSTAKLFRMAGSYGLLAAMVVLAIFAVIMTGKTGNSQELVLGALLIVVLAAAQYVAGKLCDALTEYGRAAGDKLPSTIVPNCVALISLAGGIGMLLWWIAVAVATSAYPFVLFGVAAFLIEGFLAAIAMNPSAVGIVIAAGGNAGQHAIDVVTFLLKAFARLVPVAFGVGVICGVLLLGYACGAAFSGQHGPLIAANAANIARDCLRWAAFLPLIGYGLFLLVSLVLDLCRAVLGLRAGIEKGPKLMRQESRE